MTEYRRSTNVKLIAYAAKLIIAPVNQRPEPQIATAANLSGSTIAVGTARTPRGLIWS
jgi:hypothetical protein